MRAGTNEIKIEEKNPHTISLSIFLVNFLELSGKRCSKGMVGFITYK